LDLSSDALDYLDQRASLYNGSAAEMLAITPSTLTTEDSVLDFWAQRHLSHILPQSDYPELADNWSNIIPEDPSTNLARNDDIMSSSEFHDALLNNEVLAALLQSGQ
jgi:hypothetical protein